jgi:hypothetical protein
LGYDYLIEDVKRAVGISLGVLSKNDSFLLQNAVNERSVSHKLAEYLQSHFPDWNVDCEYDRKGLDNPKILDGIRECSERRRTDRVIPDIIIHRRNSDDNLLVIEIADQANDPCDLKKLELFTSVRGQFRYRFGLFLRFDDLGSPTLRWFKDGNEIRQLSGIRRP